MPGEGLRIKKEPYTQPDTKQSYPMRGKGRDIDIGQRLGDGEAMGIGLSDEGRV